MNKSIKLLIATVLLLLLTIPLHVYWIKAKGTVLDTAIKPGSLSGRKIRVLCVKNLKPVNGQGVYLTVKQGRHEQDDELTYWNDDGVYSFRGDTLFVSQKVAAGKENQTSPGVSQTINDLVSLTFDVLPEVIIADNVEKITVEGEQGQWKTLRINARNVDQMNLTNISIAELTIKSQVRSGFVIKDDVKINRANIEMDGTCSLDLGSAKINNVTTKLGPDVQLSGDMENVKKLLTAH
ncbi:hypothetical protein [Solitalea lacus]|uniref:hypothetical protein n=1 Tax=Solitalea lacus TaxID=2911172 RepID=UPI001EDA6E2D|nr:hypothetical protein [Solitalea lacus]UKJ07549.1 hypothetical protein L2B55_18780 [Solitalea lacus]